MLRIRLRRTGKKKQASYRVVVADKDAPRDGDFVEIVGHYNPRTEPNTVVLNEERVKYWLSKGARPSETVHHILYKQGIWEVEPPKRPTVPSKAEQAATAKAAEEAAAREAEEQARAQAQAEAAQAAEAESEAPAAEGEGAAEQAEEETPAAE